MGVTTDLRLFDRVFAFTSPSTIRIYSPVVDIVCDVCGATIPAYTFFVRKPLQKGTACRANPNACKCRDCFPFKVLTRPGTTRSVDKIREEDFVYDSWEKFMEIATPDKFVKESNKKHGRK
jgi:hypothetical protein